MEPGTGAGGADQTGGSPAGADHAGEGTTAALKNAAIHSQAIKRALFLIVERQGVYQRKRWSSLRAIKPQLEIGRTLSAGTRTPPRARLRINSTTPRPSAGSFITLSLAAVANALAEPLLVRCERHGGPAPVRP